MLYVLCFAPHLKPTNQAGYVPFLLHRWCTGLVQVKLELLRRDQAGRVLLVYEKAFFLMVLNYGGAGSLFFSDLDLHRDQGSKYTASSNPSLSGTTCFHFDRGGSWDDTIPPQHFFRKGDILSSGQLTLVYRARCTIWLSPNRLSSSWSYLLTCSAKSPV